MEKLENKRLLAADVYKPEILPDLDYTPPPILLRLDKSYLNYLSYCQK